MDEGLYTYHPHRTTALYERADLIKSHVRRKRAVEVDSKYRLLELFEMADFDEVELDQLMASSSGKRWSAREAAAHIEYAYQEFRRGEQEMFDLGPLARRMAAARPDNVVPGEIDLPDDPFYLHFGDCGLRSPFPGFHVDGCYVEFIDEEAGFLKFTTVCNHPWLEKLKTGPLIEALVQHGRCYVFDAALNKPFSEGLLLTGCEDEEFWQPYLRPVANAAMAAIEYVCGVEPEMEWAYLPDAPNGLVRKTMSDDHREAQRATGMLAAMGYRPMWFCGSGTR